MDMEKQLETVREALKSDPRTTYRIAKDSGVQMSTLQRFRGKIQHDLTKETLAKLVPHVMPGHAFGLHAMPSQPVHTSPMQSTGGAS